MREHIDSGALAMTADFSYGISTLACCIVRERYVSLPSFSFSGWIFTNRCDSTKPMLASGQVSSHPASTAIEQTVQGTV